MKRKANALEPLRTMLDDTTSRIRTQRNRWLLVLMVIGTVVMSSWDILDRKSREVGNGHVERIAVKLLLVAPPAVVRISASRTTLILSILTTLVSLAGYHYSHQHSQTLEIAILCGAGLGVLLGTAAGLDETAILLRALPWGVVIAVLSSVLGERPKKGAPSKLGKISFSGSKTFA